MTPPDLALRTPADRLFLTSQQGFLAGQTGAGESSVTPAPRSEQAVGES